MGPAVDATILDPAIQGEPEVVLADVEPPRRLLDGRGGHDDEGIAIPEQRWSARRATHPRVSRYAGTSAVVNSVPA